MHGTFAREHATPSVHEGATQRSRIHPHGDLIGKAREDATLNRSGLDLAGLQIKTLRYLHARGYVEATWMQVGEYRIRVYSAAAIARLKRIAVYMQAGFPPRVAAAKVSQEVSGEPS